MKSSNLFRFPEVSAEYERWTRILNDNETPADGLSTQDVLRVHFLIVDMFYGKNAGLGGIGPKDIGLLESAVSRQHSGYGQYIKWERAEDKAATLMYGLIMNHAFHDANKRTAFLSTLYLLRRSGLVIQVSEKQFEDFTVIIADNSFRKREKFLRSFSDQEDAEIKYVSHMLKTMTRQFDKKDCVITYRELDRILHRFDFGLFYPSNNYIDVCRINGEEPGERICRIGFPSWSKQVLRQNLKHLRTETGLDALNGVDSHAFFRDAEPVSSLMAKYYEPLVRLADR